MVEADELSCAPPTGQNVASTPQSISQTSKRLLRRLMKQGSNPFSSTRGDDTTRENFPNLDLALMAESTKNTTENTDIDNSVLSQASSDLALSIGATAALNEHNRFVCKHGLDGDNVNNNNNNNISPAVSKMNPLDEQWDMILEGKLKPMAGSPSNPRLDFWFSMSCQDGSNEISDVKSDFTHDYFSSSKVLMLATPERNMNRPDIVFTRGGDENEDNFFHASDEDENDEFEDGESETEQLIAPEFLATLEERADYSHLEEELSSSISLSGADLSHISAAMSEDHFSPSDVSLLHDFQIATEASHELPIIFVTDPPSGIDSSLLSSSFKSLGVDRNGFGKENTLNTLQSNNSLESADTIDNRKHPLDVEAPKFEQELTVSPLHSFTNDLRQTIEE